MKKIQFLLAAGLFSISTISSTDANNIVSHDDTVDGISQSDFVNMWWQWAVSMPSQDSPVRDKTGINCDVNQAGPVWFLAGGYGSSKIQRTCAIPADKHIFFPVINMLYYPQNLTSVPTCDQVKRGAALNNNHLISFVLKIDDKKYINPVFFRQASGHCFDLTARKPNEKMRVYPAATDGYWVMLKPMTEGMHKISFRAEYNNPESGFGRMVQDIAYELKIVSSHKGD